MVRGVLHAGARHACASAEELLLLLLALRNNSLWLLLVYWGLHASLREGHWHTLTLVSISREKKIQGVVGDEYLLNSSARRGIGCPDKCFRRLLKIGLIYKLTILDRNTVGILFIDVAVFVGQANHKDGNITLLRNSADKQEVVWGDCIIRIVRLLLFVEAQDVCSIILYDDYST